MLESVQGMNRKSLRRADVFRFPRLITNGYFAPRLTVHHQQFTRSVCFWLSNTITARGVIRLPKKAIAPIKNSTSPIYLIHNNHKFVLNKAEECSCNLFFFSSSSIVNFLQFSFHTVLIFSVNSNFQKSNL